MFVTANHLQHSVILGGKASKTPSEWSPEAIVIKLFWHNLRYYQHIALILYSGYAARGVNYAEIFFYKIDTCKVGSYPCPQMSDFLCHCNFGQIS